MPGGDVSLPPDRRELLCLAAAATLGVTAALTGLGPRLLATWVPTPVDAASPAYAALGVIARFFPWLVALGTISVAYTGRWMPRMHQRLLEPSLLAAWLTAAVAGGLSYALGVTGAWPWTWASTSPDTLSIVTQFVVTRSYLSLALWGVGAVLLVPIVLELVFRYGLLEFLRRRGVGDGVAIALSSIAFGATFLAPWATAPAAALRHALLATVLGAALGVLVIRAKRGGGLGLVILAHVAFAAVPLAVLVMSVLPS